MSNFTTLPLGRLTRYAHASLKTPSENPVGINGSRRKEYIAFANCIAHNLQVKTHKEKKEYNI
jgi:hypothetical protein